MLRVDRDAGAELAAQALAEQKRSAGGDRDDAGGERDSVRVCDEHRSAEEDW